MSVAAAISTGYLPTVISPGPLPSVLVVEDQLSVRWWLIDQFREMGILPMTATDGYEAIKLAGERRPDLILLDGLVPKMHGFEIARFVRAIDRDYRPTIAVMTAIYKNIRYRNEAKLKYGIDDYLIKPLQPELLAGLVERAKENL